MPILYILAGPNGAGKTTFYYTAVEQGFIDPALPFINVDLIIKNELGGFTTKNFARAEELVRIKIGDHLRRQESFMIESNLARSSDYEWLQSVASRGYEIVLYFLYTSNVEINIERVRERVKEGGHDVPNNIIIDRYRMALLYLRKEILKFQEVHLIDNSGETAEEKAIIINGKIVEKQNESPEWVSYLLYFIEKLL